MDWKQLAGKTINLVMEDRREHSLIFYFATGETLTVYPERGDSGLRDRHMGVHFINRFGQLEDGGSV